jgi:hypothetical protein
MAVVSVGWARVVKINADSNKTVKLCVLGMLLN